MKAVVDLTLNFGWFTGRVTGTIEVPEPAMPGLIRLTVTGQEGSMGLIFRADLPAPVVTDVAVREVSVKIGDAEPVVSQLPADAVVVENLVGDRKATVVVELTDTDTSGNRGDTRVQTFVLEDTFAPPMPGEIGLTVTGQND